MIRHHLGGLDRDAWWAGMGMGKTSSALFTISVLESLGEIRRVLIPTTKRVANSVWPREVRKWEDFHHLTVQPVTGSLAARKAAARSPALIHTVNYENLPWLIKGWGDDWPYDMVVADESTKLKNLRIDFRVSSKKKRFLRSSGGLRAGHLGKVAHTRVGHWINLTGTPAPNGLLDLWGQTWFLDAGERLGRTFTGFKDRWFKSNPNGYGSIPLEFAQDAIQRRLSDICLPINAKDWFDIKDPIVRPVYVDLPPKARAIYEQFEKDMFALIGPHEIDAGSTAVKTMRCLQLANGSIYTEKPKYVELHDAKLDALEDIVAEAAGMPVLVAYHFKPDLERLMKRFPKGRVLDDDPATEDDWNAGRIPLLFAHPQSAGHGLNLQDGSNIIVFFANWWNFEEYLQIIERIGPTRQLQSGHDRPVFVYLILARKTADILVIANRLGKQSLQDTLMEAKLHGTPEEAPEEAFGL